jgi:hypothetical protein
MGMEKKFIVYAYLREDRTFYYIGKGLLTRPYQCGKTNRVVPCPRTERGEIDKDRILILYGGTKFEESIALNYEKGLINLYGRKDLYPDWGILRNLTDGGDGTSGRKMSGEQRKSLSERMGNYRFSSERKERYSRMFSGRGNPRYKEVDWLHEKHGIVKGTSASDLIKMFPEQSLDHSWLRKVARGKASNHKGWGLLNTAPG